MEVGQAGARNNGMKESDTMARAKMPVGERRRVMACVMLRPGEREAVDRVAKATGKSRSTVMREAVLQALAQQGKGTA
jgi:hypothetical protein